jgi:hypothetical protein
MLDRIERSFKILKLTRKYFRASQVPDNCEFNVNGLLCKVTGDHVLSMMLDIISNDSYGLKRFKTKTIDNIVDIGANVGVFSLHAHTLFPNARLLAFEPSTQSRQFLEKNTKGLNIEVYPYAVGNSRGKIILNECELISLDDVVAKLQKPVSLLKLDCEGSEYEIMKSSALKSFRYIVGEMHTCQHGDPTLGLKILNNNGFRIDKWFPFPDGLAGIFWATNTNI